MAHWKMNGCGEKNKVKMLNLKFVKRRQKVFSSANKCLESGHSSENKTLS